MPHLEASRKPASWYDKTSSHYLGGAHNAALEAFKNAPASAFKKDSFKKVEQAVEQEVKHLDSFYDRKSSHYKGGAANHIFEMMKTQGAPT